MATLEQSRHQQEAPHYDKKCAYGATARSDVHSNQDALWPWLDPRRSWQDGDFKWPLATFDYLMGGRLYIVADGVTNCTDGSKASSESVQRIVRNYYRIAESNLTLHSTEDAIQDALRTAIVNADREIKDEFTRTYPGRNGQEDGWFATCVCALIRGNKLYLAYVGDSRAYQLTTQGAVVQQTTDHISSRDANAINQAMGTGVATPGIGRPVVLKEGDRVLLCTDGLYKPFSLFEQWLREYLRRNSNLSVSDLPERLVKEVINQYAKSKIDDDDITAIIFEYKSQNGNVEPEFKCWWSSNYSAEAPEWKALIEDYRQKAEKGGEGADRYLSWLRRLDYFEDEIPRRSHGSRTVHVTLRDAETPESGELPPPPSNQSQDADVPQNVEVPGQYQPPRDVEAPTQAQPAAQQRDPDLDLKLPADDPALILESAKKLIDKYRDVWNSMGDPLDLREDRLYHYLNELLSIIPELRKSSGSQAHLDALVDVRSRIRLTVRLFTVLLHDSQARRFFDPFLWPEVERYYGAKPGVVFDEITRYSLRKWRERFFDYSDLALEDSKPNLEDRFRIRWHALRWLECASAEELEERGPSGAGRIGKLSPTWKDTHLRELKSLKANDSGRVAVIQEQMETDFLTLSKLTNGLITYRKMNPQLDSPFRTQDT